MRDSKRWRVGESFITQLTKAKQQACTKYKRLQSESERTSYDFDFDFDFTGARRPTSQPSKGYPKKQKA